MEENDSCQQLADRLAQGNLSEQDLSALRRALLASGQANVIQIGKYNVHIGQGENIQIGDRIYQGPDLETLRRLVRAAQEQIAADRYAASLQEYFLALRTYCANLPYLTLHDIRPPKNLDEVYVPLRAKPRSSSKDKADLLEFIQPSAESLSVVEVLQKADIPHLIILGEAGAGKSTLLRQLAERAWDDPRAIGLSRPHLPMLVPLRTLATTGGALEDRLAAALSNELSLVETPPEGFFRAWAQQMDAPWLLLLDGLDEVPAAARPGLMQWLKGMLPLIGAGRLLVTSRLSAYEEGEWGEKQFAVYDIQPFTPEQTRAFAEKWFGADASDFLSALENVHAAELGSTPLLLTIAAKVYLHRKEETGSGSLPERRSQLYEEFINTWLQEAELRGLRAELGDDLTDLAKPTLARLAFAMTDNPTLTDEERLARVAAEYLGEELRLGKAAAEAKARRFLQVMGRRSGVFMRSEFRLIRFSMHGEEAASHRLEEHIRRQRHYGWAHPTFQEYLAAWLIVKECKRKVDQQECVWKRAVSRRADNRYRGVSEFAIGIFGGSNDVTLIIQRLLNEDWISDSMAEWLAWQPLTRHYLFQGELGALAAGAALLEGIIVKKNILYDVIQAVLRFYHSSTLYKNEFAFIVNHSTFQQLISQYAPDINSEREVGDEEDEEEIHS